MGILVVWKNAWLIVRRSERDGRDRYWVDGGHGWTVTSSHANKFENQESAESRIFQIVTERPKYIGKLAVVEIIDKWVD